MKENMMEKHDGKHVVSYGYPQMNLILVGELFEFIHNPRTKFGHFIGKIFELNG